MYSIITLVTECCVLWALNGDSQKAASTLLVVIFILLFSVAFNMDIRRNPKLNFVQTPLILGYLWRVFLLFFDLYGQKIYTLPNSGADTSMFYYGAVSYVYTGVSRRGLFSKVMGTIFSYIGTSRLYGQFLVMLCSIVSLCILSCILYEIDIEEDIKYRTMGIVALLPNFAILSSIFLRESLVTMFISLSIYCFVLWMQRNTEWYFYIAIIFALTASAFHSGCAAMVIGYIVVRMLYNKETKNFSGSMRAILPTAFFALVCAFILLNYSDVFLSKMGNVDSLEDIANVNDKGGSSYARYVGNSSSIGNFVIYTLPRIIYFLFSPFPWQWRGLGDIIAFVFSSLFYFLTVRAAFRYLKQKKENNRSLVIGIMIVAFCIVFVFGWGCSNTGTAARHREKSIIVFAILYALTHENNNDATVFLGTRRML